MPIVELQRRLREVGRIRMGDKGDRGQPQKLTTWRLTSPDKTALEGAAQLYGGEVRPWKDHPGYFELYTKSGEIPILFAPIDMTQWFEVWSAGGCKRRCDGETCQLATPEGMQEVACECDPDDRECKLTTRLSVMLPDLPALGAWRLDTHGWYAATELPTTAETLIRYAKMGKFVPAMLAIEPRTVKRNNQTRQFIVPVIRVREKLSDVLAGRSAITLELPATEAPVLPAADAPVLEAANPPDKSPVEQAIDSVLGEEGPLAAADLHVNQATGEIIPPKTEGLSDEILDMLVAKGVQGKAMDWFRDNYPYDTPDEAIRVFALIEGLGKSVLPALLKTHGMDPQPNWAAFAASIESAANAAKEAAPAQ